MSMDTMVKFGGNWTAQRRLVLPVLGSMLLLGASAAGLSLRLDRGIRLTTIEHLDAIVRSTQSSLEFWFQTQVRAAEALAEDPVVRDLSIELASAPRGAVPLDLLPEQSAFREHVRPMLDRYGALDGIILDQHGDVLATAREGDPDVLMSGIDEQRDRLARAFSGQPQFLPPSTRAAPHILGIAIPIRARGNAVVAVLVLRGDSRAQFSKLMQAGRFGKTVEIFAVDEQGRTLTDSRYDDLDKTGPSALARQSDLLAQARDPGVEPQPGRAAPSGRENRASTPTVQLGRHQQLGSHTNAYRNIRGQPVLGVRSYSRELGMEIGVEIGETEALTAYTTLRYSLWGCVAAVAGLLSALVLSIMQHRHRIRRLIEESNVVLEQRVFERTRDLASANGRLAVEVNERRSSESRLRAVQAMLEETSEKYAKLSQIDPLTELANRRRFDEFLEREWRRCIRNRSQMSLLLLDFDYFKLFNDTYGHGAGDECLRAVAEVLSAAARRPGDLAARIGGEEFAVVLCDTGSEGALRVARQIHAWIEDLAIEHDTTQVHGVDNVTISIGVACMQPELTSNPSVLVYHADEALYAAKQDGRNCIRTYEVGDMADRDETFTRAKGLRAHDLVRRTLR